MAVLTRERPVFRLREAITGCLGTERMDLVDLRLACMRFEIIRTGQLLYALSQEMQERFELETLHLYRDTAPLRHQQREYLKKEASPMVLRREVIKSLTVFPQFGQEVLAWLDALPAD